MSHCMGATPRRLDDNATVTLRESDGWVVARDEETGVSSQGETKAEALENLADAIALYERPEPEGEETPEPSDAPWF